MFGAIGTTRARLPFAGEAVGAGLVAMVAADAPLALAQVSSPVDWTTSDWASDLLPHLGYGAATAFALDRLVA